jgi:hypothetical protein
MPDRASNKSDKSYWYAGTDPRVSGDADDGRMSYVRALFWAQNGHNGPRTAAKPIRPTAGLQATEQWHGTLKLGTHMMHNMTIRFSAINVALQGVDKCPATVRFHLRVMSVTRTECNTAI